MIRAAVILTAAVIACSPAAADPFKAPVRVIDGDTFEIGGNTQPDSAR